MGGMSLWTVASDTWQSYVCGGHHRTPITFPSSPGIRFTAGAGALILDILHALAQGADAAGHEVQDAVSPSLLLLVRSRWGGEVWSNGEGAVGHKRQPWRCQCPYP